MARCNSFCATQVFVAGHQCQSTPLGALKMGVASKSLPIISRCLELTRTSPHVVAIGSGSSHESRPARPPTASPAEDLLCELPQTEARRAIRGHPPQWQSKNATWGIFKCCSYSWDPSEQRKLTAAPSSIIEYAASWQKQR